MSAKYRIKVETLLNENVYQQIYTTDSKQSAIYYGVYMMSDINAIPKVLQEAWPIKVNELNDQRWRLFHKLQKQELLEQLTEDTRLILYVELNYARFVVTIEPIWEEEIPWFTQIKEIMSPHKSIWISIGKEDEELQTNITEG